MRLSLLSALLLALSFGDAAATTVEGRPWAGPVAAAAGRTGRIIRLDTTAAALNPAAMSLSPSLSWDSQYDADPRRRSHSITTGAVDSRTSVLAFGSIYSLEWARPDLAPDRDLAWHPKGVEAPEDRRRVHRTHVALSYGFFQRRLSLGASLDIYATQRAIRPDQRRISLSAGIVGVPVKGLGLQVSARNLIPTRMSVAPLVLSAGASLSLLELVFVEVDVDTDFASFDEPTVDLYAGAVVQVYTRLGSEDGYPKPTLSISAGYFSEEGFGRQNVTWGLGWIGTQGRLYYAMGIAVTPMEPIVRGERTWPGRLTHSATFSVHF
jgi:hypothetical protein